MAASGLAIAPATAAMSAAKIYAKQAARQGMARTWGAGKLAARPVLNHVGRGITNFREGMGNLNEHIYTNFFGGTIVMNKANSLRAWTDINSLLSTHKLINLGLVAVCVLQVFVIGWMYVADPIVVIREGERQQYHAGRRTNLPISEAAVEEFVRKFLHIRYEWDKLDHKQSKKACRLL